MSLVLRFGDRQDAAARARPSVREALRTRLTEEIEERIALLDALDGDPDLEPVGDDEPSLGRLSNGGWSYADFGQGLDEEIR